MLWYVRIVCSRYGGFRAWCVCVCVCGLWVHIQSTYLEVVLTVWMCMWMCMMDPYRGSCMGEVVLWLEMGCVCMHGVWGMGGQPG